MLAMVIQVVEFSSRGYKIRKISLPKEYYWCVKKCQNSNLKRQKSSESLETFFSLKNTNLEVHFC